MSKHTPGSWEIDWYICREGETELWRVPRSIGPTYADHNHWAGNYITVDEADARLIAAAPLMYEALKDAMDVCIWPSATVSNAFEKARAAIAKAEGK